MNVLYYTPPLSYTEVPYHYVSSLQIPIGLINMFCWEVPVSFIDVLNNSETDNQMSCLYMFMLGYNMV